MPFIYLKNPLVEWSGANSRIKKIKYVVWELKPNIPVSNKKRSGWHEQSVYSLVSRAVIDELKGW